MTTSYKPEEEKKMDVLDAIWRRRTIRDYKMIPVDDETLQTILNAGRLAPSWANTQTTRFVVVKDTAIKTQLADIAVRPGNRAIKALKTAPIVIAVCAELNKAGFRDGQPHTNKGGFWYMFDAGLAMENMVLAAETFGLGTLFVGGMSAEKAESILGVPEGFAFVILMTLGYPDEKPEARPRKDLSEVVFQNRFGAR
jgi:nitroreductase